MQNREESAFSGITNWSIPISSLLQFYLLLNSESEQSPVRVLSHPCHDIMALKVHSLDSSQVYWVFLWACRPTALSCVSSSILPSQSLSEFLAGHILAWANSINRMDWKLLNFSLCHHLILLAAVSCSNYSWDPSFIYILIQTSLEFPATFVNFCVTLSV